MKPKVKKIILILTSICISLFSYKSMYVYGSTSSNALGTASDFSIFVLNDHIHKNSDTTGRVAVGNNATYENYSIGNSLDMSNSRSDLIVGNTLTAIGGNNFNGNTSIGSKGKVINYTMTNNNNISNQPKKENIIDFNQEKNYLYTKTKELNSLTPNGSVSNNYGQLNLKGSNETLIVFNITSDNLKGINGINLDVPESATVIINIIGKNTEIGNLSIFYKMNIPSENIYKRWLWNFPQTETLNLYSISVKGSILAPYATFDAKGSGNIEGTIVLNNFYNYNSGFEVHNHPFNGSISTDDKSKTTTTSSEKNSNKEQSSDNITKNVTTPKKAESKSNEDTFNTAKETTSKTEINKNTNTNSDIVENNTAGKTNLENSTEAKETTDSPKTGDTKSLNITLFLLGASIIALIFSRKFS
ncbi:choice-of-anchor A family protein [Clostridium sp. SHJSY1]|uniref:choice-of-anchor A family protein n=1 Tax=Clostridium sp. SHJSY1 TaxID=2942483 RepID=UPI00287639A4|nr:choice-of-anchor A family protein [Clostridium sp. SHJSY1]MDS0526293.1 choice-of-anchor A family protein [Clostridium sp. SHJSY1]